MPLDESGVETSRAEVWRAAQRSEECGIGARARGDRAVERFGQPLERDIAGCAVRDHLGDHRIVERRHLGACLHAGIDADALA